MIFFYGSSYYVSVKLTFVRNNRTFFVALRCRRRTFPSSSSKKTQIRCKSRIFNTFFTTSINNYKFPCEFYYCSSFLCRELLTYESYMYGLRTYIQPSYSRYLLYFGTYIHKENMFNAIVKNLLSVAIKLRPYCFRACYNINYCMSRRGICNIYVCMYI